MLVALDELAPTVVAVMVLFAVMNVTIVLVPDRLASITWISLPYIKGGGGASYFPVSAITDRLYARNQLLITQHQTVAWMKMCVLYCTNKISAVRVETPALFDLADTVCFYDLKRSKNLHVICLSVLCSYSVRELLVIYPGP